MCRDQRVEQLRPLRFCLAVRQAPRLDGAEKMERCPTLPGRGCRDRAGAMKATVYVRLKQEVLDPQGDAVKRALDALGFAGVKGVRVGKLIEIELDPDHAGAAAPAELQQKLARMADEMLANTVIEDYEVKV